VYVEIKQRVNKVTQKRRVRLPYAEALALCDRRQMVESDSQPFVEEVLDLVSRLDLGATAKALAADRAARQVAAVTGCGVLVSLGGDLATAGPAPEGGWRIALADDHARPAPEGGPAVAVTSGALATSGIRVRTWRRGGRVLHHIVDPITGGPAAPVWRTVTVAAATCVDANAVSTASIVLGERAPDWLRATALPARLTGLDGTVTRVGGWPPDALAPAPAGCRSTASGGPR